MTDDGPPTDPASLVRWMDAMDAYKDKAVFDSAPDDAPGPMRLELARVMFPQLEGEPLKAVPVRWFPGDPVRLAGGPIRKRGVVIGVFVRPDGLSYEVSWPRSGDASTHYGLELEDAN